ncbi:hypothetical protein MRX96_041231 [Rhipicephalus microplus]
MTNPNGMLVVCGDFNAPHKDLRYNCTSAKRSNLLEEALNAGFVLYTDPGNPTRIGTSTTRDANLDLIFARLSAKVGETKLGEEEAGKQINAKYLRTAATEFHPDHEGSHNPELDREIEE